MKQNVLILLMSTMALAHVNAETYENGKQEEIICQKFHPWGKPIKRSLMTNMRAFLSSGYIILVPAPSDKGNVCITIQTANGTVVKSETVTVSPNHDTTIYIDDLESGAYDLNIELEDYTLYGGFDIE